MTNTIQRELQIPQPPEQVWRAITDSATLAEWMYPNDFEPRVGHQFTFRVPPNPKVNFEGLIVNCEVLECEPPSRLEFSWSGGEPVENTKVSFRLEPDGDGTRLMFEHSGFDLAHPFGEHAFKGAGYGWAKMLKQLTAVVAGQSTANRNLAKTADSEVVIRLTVLEAVVIDAFLRRYSETDRLTIEDKAEQRALWNLQCIFEKVADPSWPSLEEASAELRDEEEE